MRYYITNGHIRGDCGHLHRKMEAARECLHRDQRGCQAQGGYSDRNVIVIDGDSERVVTMDELAGEEQLQ